MVKKASLALFFLVLLSCTTNKEINEIQKEFEGWYHKDFEKDSVPGISLNRAYEELIMEESGEEVIVAIIDSPIDIDHEDLRNQIYSNKDEIDDNGIDDDNNGYVDDIHGWNFLGYGKDKTIQYANYDYIRVIRRLGPLFEGKDSSQIKNSERDEYLKYLKALGLLEAGISDAEGETAYRESELDNFKKGIELFPRAYDQQRNVFIQEIMDTISPTGEQQKEMLEVVQDIAYYGLYPELLKEDYNGVIARKEKSNNLAYNERKIIGDDPYILDNIKGTPKVKPRKGTISHGTQVAGAIAATRDNGTGIKGISNKIRLMVLGVFPKRGDELDKDVANAIRYAVDNGAKVINYSHGKYFIDKEEYVLDAMKYAEGKGVIIVSAAGNEPKNLDDPKENPYPRDNDDNFKEIVANHIKVAASGRKLKFVKPSWSSYGKNNVDLYAPGQRIMTTQSGSHAYFELGGSSLSTAMVSGTIALLYSQYPNLTMREVKKILLESGTRYDQELKLGNGSLVDFTDLSKSGTVLNVYNALVMAKELTEKGR